VVIRRAVAALVALGACKHTPAVPVDPHELDAALDCAVTALGGVYESSHYHVASALGETLFENAPPSAAITVLKRMGATLHESDDLAAVAFWLARLGDAADAHTINEHALALAKTEPLPRDGRETMPAEAMVVAWTGDPARAESLVTGDVMGLFLVAEGAARAGNRPAAEHAYAEAMKLTSSVDGGGDAGAAAGKRGSFDSPPVHGQRAEALVWLGRVAEARAIAAAEPKPEWRAYILELVINAAVETHASEIGALLRETGELVDTLPTAPPTSPADMSGLEDRFALDGALDAHGDHDAAAALRAKIVAVLPKLDGEALSMLAVQAEIGNRHDEADALFAKAGTAASRRDKIFVTMHRGQLAQAIGDLAAFDDAELRPQVLSLLWAELAANPDIDGALVARFKAQACRAVKR